DADTAILERIESPSISPETMDIISMAIRSRRIKGSALSSCVGEISDRDALAQAADRLLAMEGVTTTLVCGFKEGTIHLSARSRRTDLDLGETLRQAFDDIGSAGGHTDMAGAQIPLGLFEELTDEADSLADLVDDRISERFFDALTVDAVRIAPEALPTSDE
ncbi:MAG: bifunctional oligoribonuclease/PAP phosphatase NrnA, partial [Halobacteriaceae archaeon]